MRQMPKGNLIAPTVILVRPREEGNIGAVARAMANMGLKNLVLVEPAPALGGVARGFGVGGWHILDACQRVSSLTEATAPFRRLVGTSSARSRPLRHTRVISSRQLPAFLAHDAPTTTTALLFGPEDSGLTRNELEGCEPVVAIPSTPEHPTLNLAQSVLILAYELYLAQHLPPDQIPGGTAAETMAETMAETAAGTMANGALGSTGSIAPPATNRELEILLQRSEAVLEKVGVSQKPRRAIYLREMRRFARRGAATSHQIRLLLRLANRVLFALTSAARTAAIPEGRESEESDRVPSAEPHPPPRRRLDK
jgi:TrmH family RNA methyltransferase